MAGLVLLVVVGCRGIAGYRDISYAFDAGCVAPALPSTGDGRVRVANLSTKPGDVDFCIRQSGSNWISSVFANGGPSCQPGLAYPQVTRPFAAPAGTIDVKTIPAGESCSNGGTSEVDGVTVSGTGLPVVTLLRFGGVSTKEHIVALPEEPLMATAYGTAERLRIINALSGGGAIDFGLTNASSLPTTLTPSLSPPLLPGAALSMSVSMGLWVSDGSGYSTLPNEGLSLGAALQGQPDALFVAETNQSADQQTLFAIGDVTKMDVAERPRGLMCEDLATSSNPLLARCAISALPSLQVDTVSTSLYGAGGWFEAARRPFVVQAIAARTTDLMCLFDTDRDSDKALIAQAAAAQFPYSYSVQTTLETKPTDPTTADGSVPPAPTAPPCAGVDPAAVSVAMQCAAQQCTNTGDDTGYISTSNCLSGACGAKFLPLYRTGVAQEECLDCLLYGMTSTLSVSQAQQDCETMTEQPFAFAGMSSSLMLSHYPLSHQEAFILPGTGWRREVLHAQVELENDQSVDFYCAHIISPLNDANLAYTGNYGQDVQRLPDGGSENGWEDEQVLQVGKVIAFIQKTSKASKLPAIIVGDWHASIQAAQPDGGLVVGNLSPEVMEALRSAFQQEEPMGYQEQCSYCPAPQNPYNSNASPASFSHSFLFNFPAGSIIDDQIWGTAPSVVPLSSIPYESAPASGMGPVWEYFPRVVYVVRPPAN